MLITKEVKIYKTIISIDKLAKNSHKLVDVKCDNCGKEKKVRYQSYNISTNNNTEQFYCGNKECTNKKRNIIIQEKYGVDNVFQLDVIKEKIKLTNLDLYGVENPHQNEKIKNKAENTNLKRYGVKNPFQSEAIKKKMKITNKKNLGVEFPSQSELVKDKMKITSLKNYGFEYPIQNKDFFNKHLKNGFKLTGHSITIVTKDGRIYVYLNEKMSFSTNANELGLNNIVLFLSGVMQGLLIWALSELKKTSKI